MATDPVCGMEVDPQHAAAQATYDGVTYYFCSQDCKQRFELAPALYAQRTAPLRDQSVTAPGGKGPSGDERHHDVMTRGTDVVEGHDDAMTRGTDVVEGHHDVMTHGLDVVEGHGSETTSSGTDVIERGGEAG